MPLKVLCNFITLAEELAMTTAISARFKRLKMTQYEPGHFDNVISRYREASMSDSVWSASPECLGVIARMKQHAIKDANDNIQWKPLHVLDLSDTGYIKPHVDHTDYSGGYICGLSLLSDCVMRFKRTQSTAVDDDKLKDAFSVLLPARSFYIQSYDYY
jgi:alkylated DNA repair protein alkB family protein 7